MKDTIQKLIDELEAIENPTAFLHMAKCGLITALDNLKYHDDAMVTGNPTPIAPVPTPVAEVKL